MMVGAIPQYAQFEGQIEGKEHFIARAGIQVANGLRCVLASDKIPTGRPRSADILSAYGWEGKHDDD